MACRMFLDNPQEYHGGKKPIFLTEKMADFVATTTPVPGGSWYNNIGRCSSNVAILARSENIVSL